jgi:GTP pyrophosphokinase
MAVETNLTAPETARESLRAALAAIRALDLPAEALPLREAALEVAGIVRELEADDDIVVAAAIGPLLEAGVLARETAEKRFGAAAAGLARELNRLGKFGLPPDWAPGRSLPAGHAEALRKMLLAVVADVRLVVVRLAEQLQKMRAAKAGDADAQRRLAIETREVYAPLANRLGVWRVKWELEDLAFRCLEPGEYKRIATALKARRSERERDIVALQARLLGELAAAGIRAAIEGRPKHIYSIWRKMQVKGLAFEQVMDVRAARVLVDSVAECYAALGIVHSLWPFIPGEFDDYIATPKGNRYRSIHTAVIGPAGEPVEIQIRTHEMHADSERGVAAHWRYKEGGRKDRAYEDKINELRALLAPAEAAADPDRGGDFLERVRLDLFHDRIYVLSPKGAIIDVPEGGTPLDFAYQVHTDIGHRTRGAKINGRMVPLDYRLKNGETVEILTAKEPAPSRDWLSGQSGYLASPRHRNKVRAWFRRQHETENKAADPALEGRAIQRPGIHSPPAAEPPERAREAPWREPESEVQGIGDLLSTYARCCRPVPPEPIAGYITVGRGVSIHAQSCANLARLGARSPARMLRVAWGDDAGREFPVDIEVEAFDRRGLVRDVSAALADDKIGIRAMNTITDPRDRIARMRIAIHIKGLGQLAHVLARIGKLPNVLRAQRRR